MWKRRSVLATGAALSIGTGLTSVGAAEADIDELPDGGADFTRPDGVAWRYDGPRDTRSATVEGDRLYTESDGTVYAIDTADGSLVWETGDIGADGPPVVEGGIVYVAGEPVQAIDAETGEVNWESEFESFEMAVGHGMVYTSEDGTVHALDAEDGSIEWERNELTVEWEISGETEEFTVDSLVAGDTDDDLVYVSGDVETGMFTVAGLDPTTGELEMTMGRTEQVAGLAAESGYMGIQPTFDYSFLYDISTKERVGSVYPSVGYTFSGDGFFGANRYGDVSAYDLSAGGELAWEMEYAQSLPQVVGDTAIVLYGPSSVKHTPEESEDEDRVVAYDLATGEEQWRYVFDEREWTHGSMSAIAVDDDTVYLERDGELLALRSETEAPDDPEDSDPGDDEQDESDEQDEDQQGGKDDSDPGDGDSGNGGSGSDNGGSSGDDDDGDVGNGNDGNGDAGNETNAENNSDADNVPGFTAGGGLLGGALGLEWLRRKAGVDESTSVNDPSE
ncbi:PQQ-binding-like beta-propeller repeat protein [Natrinema sp. DC36]|uniref:outer membrane protein assembly factor BamB family protein n=1 Tax=Natrinema sp. DC36 TaxID=2878680 RepID=UPI001CF046F5|nr:PQQ-binding-like beta-propeller repeat protein [Natrinema sp. DC36]